MADLDKSDTRLFEVVLSDGTKKNVMYSPEFRADVGLINDQIQRNNKQLQRINFLLGGIVIFLFIVLVMVCLVYFGTGIIGRTIASGLCPIN